MPSAVRDKPSSPGLQATLSSASAGGPGAERLRPHHPIACSGSLRLEPDGSLRCDHTAAPADDQRTRTCIDHSVALLLIELSQGSKPMPRAIWTGSISFGLVNVPVKVVPAVHQNDLSFHQFEEGTNARVHHKRVSEKTGKEVPYEKIVKGYELSKGHYVMVDPAELAKFTPKATKSIEIEDFVALTDIDPIYYDKTYYLVPDGGDAGKAAYALLRESMEVQGKVAIGRVVLRTKQYLAALRPAGNVLVMSTLLFHDDVVPQKEIGDLPTRAKSVPPKQRKMAGQIIQSLTTDWKPERYSDTYKQRVLEMIKLKAKGEEIVAEEEAADDKPADLMAALEASLAAAKANRKRPARKKKPA